MSPLLSYSVPTDAALDALRTVGDPVADEAVRAIFAQGQVAAVNHLIVSLVRNDDAPDAFPPAARDFFRETAALPEWADAALIRRGQAFFGRHAPRVMLILGHYSLPACYAARKGVQVLAMTNRLARNPRPRLRETAQFVFDAMSPGALGAGGAGVRSAQKVRLMHAAVRHLIVEHGWDAELGLPVNQEDMLGTLLTFSAVILDGLRKLGFVVADADAEAYLHTWNVIGVLMGVSPDLVPPDPRSADLLGLAIDRRHIAPCPAGRELAAALLSMLQETNPGPLANMPVSMMRFFLGDTRADVLGLPSADWTSELTAPLRMLGRLTGAAHSHMPLVAQLAERLGCVLMDGLMGLEQPGRRATFRMPEALR